MFENAYQAISLTEMWDYMKKDREYIEKNGGFGI
jgi:hypothetical protein